MYFEYGKQEICIQLWRGSLLESINLEHGARIILKKQIYHNDGGTDMVRIVRYCYQRLSI
jgi:hypothetical protein